MEQKSIKFAVIVKSHFPDGSSTSDLMVKHANPYALFEHSPREILSITVIDSCRIDFEF